jgi:protocatechuate 3,4-dioxygenase beta subunit
MMRSISILLFSLIPAVACAQNSPDDAACQPPAPPSRTLPSTLTLAAQSEPGDRLQLRLQFLAPNGDALRDLLVYVYHTNAAGVYPPIPDATGCLRFHGALHGWAYPDSAGFVTVHSVRPGAYPRSTEPAHLHVVVQFKGKRGFYVNDVLFEDDPRVTPAVRSAQQAPGGSGIVRATRTNGTWIAERVIRLSPPTR